MIPERKKETLEIFLSLFHVLENLGMCHRLETQEADSEMEFMCSMAVRASACDPHPGKGGGGTIG